MRVALCSRELEPFGGGGIGTFVTAAAELLATVAEVTVFTTSLHEPAYRALKAARDPRLPRDEVEIVFVPEPTPDVVACWTHIMHVYGARLLECLKAHYPDRAPDLIEFPDYLGEAFVPLQAAAGRDPFLDATTLAVRIHTTAELCELLDGYRKPDFGSRAVHDMERYALAHADRVIWQGGDILGTYQRYFGAGAIAPAVQIRYPYRGARADSGADEDYASDERLRILYAGRLERRKGVHNLVQALTATGREDVHLTIVGADTTTGPLGTSVRAQLELAIADDHRIALLHPLPREQLAAAIRAADVIAIPSLWECWPYAALEAMMLNRPVLATPVGGLVELVAPGASGWLTRGTDPESLEAGLEAVLDGRDGVARLVRGHGPQRRANELSDDQAILDGYRALAALRPRARSRRPAAPPPLVSAIVPYYRASAHVLDTIDSLQAQTYPRIEIVLVNDGSFDEPDRVLAELAARRGVIVVSQMNQGLGAARNFGVRQSRGRYVFPLDADNVAEPEFVERCVAVLQERREVAYVTSWTRYILPDGQPQRGVDEGYEPLGAHAALNTVRNVAGDAAAVLRRRIFSAGFWYSEELTAYEDWHLYRRLARAGHEGVVIPERLLRYRVRSDSMQAQLAVPHHERLRAEIESLIDEKEMQWTSSSA